MVSSVFRLPFTVSRVLSPSVCHVVPFACIPNFHARFSLSHNCAILVGCAHREADLDHLSRAPLSPVLASSLGRLTLSDSTWPRLATFPRRYKLFSYGADLRACCTLC